MDQFRGGSYNNFALTRYHYMGRLSFRVAALALAAIALASADIIPTFEPAGSEQANQGVICTGATNCILGVQDFNSWTGGPFTTDFGTSNRITGSYSGNLRVTSADQYGGAGGSGKYPEIFGRDGSYTLQLSTSSGVPGVNYFGLWFSALDAGNLLQFYSGNNLLYSFTPTKFIDLVGSCAGGADPFCGNPNTTFSGRDAGEQFAYLNFFDPNGFFDKIVFSETGSGGFESDNHTVAYVNPISVSGTEITPLPEPGFMALTGLGFIGLAFAAFRRRQRA
jgi:hypothetical protein